MYMAHESSAFTSYYIFNAKIISPFPQNGGEKQSMLCLKSGSVGPFLGLDRASLCLGCNTLGECSGVCVLPFPKLLNTEGRHPSPQARGRLCQIQVYMNISIALSSSPAQPISHSVSLGLMCLRVDFPPSCFFVLDSSSGGDLCMT